MSDTMEVWQLCPHAQFKAHLQTDHSWCEGAKRIVLRKVNRITESINHDSDLWQVSDDE